jgi:hypothetical protein
MAGELGLPLGGLALALHDVALHLALLHDGKKNTKQDKICFPLLIFASLAP